MRAQEYQFLLNSLAFLHYVSDTMTKLVFHEVNSERFLEKPPYGSVGIPHLHHKPHTFNTNDKLNITMTRENNNNLLKTKY